MRTATKKDYAHGLLKNDTASQLGLTYFKACADKESVEGVVTAIVDGFSQVDVESTDGRSFVLSRGTPGVRLDQLQVGQRLVLLVLMRGTSKVIHAELGELDSNPSRASLLGLNVDACTTLLADQIIDAPAPLRSRPGGLRCRRRSAARSPTPRGASNAALAARTPEAARCRLAKTSRSSEALELQLQLLHRARVAQSGIGFAKHQVLSRL